MATAALKRTGTRLDDILAGDSGDDELIGAGGADILVGLDGKDTIDSGLMFDAASGAYWLGVMDAGLGATDVLAQFSESRENIAALAGVLEGGIAYTPYGRSAAGRLR